ncbi:arginine-hydroxylase NDUFAF5, mitochondrial-like isoform X2 [Acanthaster planci]|uniref:Arginine-hydroxylase NDUFAF5, mitochondrial n=1 Tax=Acanthaster planci TaxID=133434 RepID=A0A8B7Y7R3_ACAPL|nr:arginine-hydroxylase NDUFAF5, mitochondrial-like isoform X2 [Acanthaster planci]
MGMMKVQSSAHSLARMLQHTRLVQLSLGTMASTSPCCQYHHFVMGDNGQLLSRCLRMSQSFHERGLLTAPSDRQRSCLMRRVPEEIHSVNLKLSKNQEVAWSPGILPVRSMHPSGPSKERVMNVFDRRAKRMQKDRAALAKDAHVYDYLKDEVAFRVADRLKDITRRFDVALDLGCGRGHIEKHISKKVVQKLYMTDLSRNMLEAARTPDGIQCVKVHADEEFLPFRDDSLDLVVSSLSLHWVNDLPGALRQGFAPHISPFTDMQDLGNLLTRAGFSMLTIDIDEITVNYPSMLELMQDLKGMGESNASWSRKSVLHRGTQAAAAAIYKDMYGNEDGSVPATFQILYMIGWKPHASQPKPAKRGSATVSLKDLDKLSKTGRPT